MANKEELSASDILYYGIELDKESQGILKEKFGAHKDWKIFCHHMTCVFTGGRSEADSRIKKWFEMNEGREIILVVSHYGVTEKCAAVRVMTEAPCRNKVKHITLGINPEKGGKPADSNFINEWTLTEPIILFGKPKIWTKMKIKK
jgi:hypothetical protein